MKNISKLFLVIITILLIGCSQIKRDGQNDELTITGSGILVSQEVALSDFDQVEAGLYFDLSIHQGEEPHVVLISDDNFIDYIQVAQAGSGISFGFKPGQAYDISGVTLKADITTPRLSKLELSGSSYAHFDGYQSNQPFEVNLTGSRLPDRRDAAGVCKAEHLWKFLRKTGRSGCEISAGSLRCQHRRSQ